MNNRQYNLYFTRHAESCSNLQTNEITDKPSKKYSDRKNIGRNNLIGGFFKGHCLYHPPLSFIGIQQSFKLSEYVNNINFDYVLCSPSLRTIMTSMIAFRYKPETKIIVVPFINELSDNCGKFDLQNDIPNISILKKMVSYCKKWMESDEFKLYDDVVINEYLYNVSKINNSNTIKQKIITVIDGILNIKPDTFKDNNDLLPTLNRRYQLIVQLKSILENIINENIKIDKNKPKDVYEYYGYVLETNNSENDLLIILRLYMYLSYHISQNKMPQVEFGYIENYDISPIGSKNITIWKINKCKYKATPNFDNFLNIILPLITKDYDNTNKQINVFIGTHGAILKKELNLDTIPFNTQIIKMECIMHNNKIYKTTNNVLTNEYIPISIRNNFQNFEILNPNFCVDHSIKGIVNSDEINNIDSTNFENCTNDDNINNNKFIESVNNVITLNNKQYILDDDLNGKFNNINNEAINSANSLNNYYDNKKKYIKYKSKYCILKKMANK
jgi:hypothetical protein